MLTTESIEHIRSVVAEHGADAWWEMETADLLPPVRADGGGVVVDKTSISYFSTFLSMSCGVVYPSNDLRQIQ